MAADTPSPSEVVGMTREEFRERFKAHMLKRTAPITEFTDGGSIAEYAHDAADGYFDDDDIRGEGPEACADCDIDYWGD